MYKITLEFGGKVQKTFNFDKPVISIGRELDNDVVIDNLGASRHHCKIEEKTGGIHVLTDLGSNNGTFVKGSRITTHNLNHGDHISIGKFDLMYENPRQQAAAMVDRKPDLMDLPTMEIGADEMKPPVGASGGGLEGGGMTLQVDASEMERMQKERASGIKAHIQFTLAGQERKVPLNKAFFIFGSGSDVDFRIKGWRIMRRHALILRTETGFMLLNVSPKKPATVNGKVADKERLKNADIIKVGKMEFTYFMGKPT